CLKVGILRRLPVLSVGPKSLSLLGDHRFQHLGELSILLLEGPESLLQQLIGIAFRNSALGFRVISEFA
ncbi:hypothetical protein LINPERPRIM_LOCUS25023, partial [Linum perenne]